MAEASSRTSQGGKPEQPAAKAPAADLPPAAESSDPAVQQILAERQTAELNGDKAAVEDADRRLADLGYASS